MVSLLLSLAAAFLLSFTSLLAVLLRVSPLTSPSQAVPAFFFSLFLTVSTASSLLLTLLLCSLPSKQWDRGTLLSAALREGGLLGLTTVLLLLFHRLDILTWATGSLTIVIFSLIELALFEPGKPNTK